MCLSADWTGAPPSSPPSRNLFHPCHTKVLICIHSHVSLCACPQVNRRTIVVSTVTTLAFSIECRYVCPHFGQACSCPLTTLGICYLGWCVWVRSSVVHLLRALVVPWSVGLCLSACCAAFFSCCYGAPLFRCCCSVFCGGCRLFGVCPCDFGACGLACSLLVPPPSPLGCLLAFSGPVVFCWFLPLDIWFYLQRSGCHTFGMACRV